MSIHPVVWTNTDGRGHESFRPTLESTRPGADLVSRLGPGLRALYGDLHAEALPDRLAALLERLSPEAMDAGAE
ncbi:MAG TPA: NepR family anti-sigma factor [Propionibacteriaceae bacterium]|nr:NepR family anti-sigma factor [Propionibacteriaceae bacterium]